jgi:membrane protease YdiL (CAAX protease family)
MAADQPRLQLTAWLAMLFYIVVLGLGSLWIELRDAWPAAWRAIAGEWGVVWSVAGALSIALPVILISGWSRRFAPVRAFEAEMRGALGHLRDGDILVLALSSAVAEEMFFRVAMQQAVGLWITALTFAAVHSGRGARLLFGTLFAGALGCLFGALVAKGSGLLTVTLAHALINYWNLGRIYGAR